MDLTPFHGPPKSAPQIPGFAARTLLGFGAHGEVWLADDLVTGDRVALKVGRRATADLVTPTGIPPDLRARATAAEVAWAGVERETALLCRIDHPHVVRLRRVVHVGDAGLALVLDLAAGGSLASLVAARGPFDPGEVSTLLIPLAGALEHLHRRGVVHGDIAPGNVLFTDDGRPQLGDLGVARVLGSRAAETWSTPGFTDPALTAGGPVDARAGDLWGLAAVAWFALTGRPPEPDAGTRSQARSRAPELTELLERCLFAVPVDRPGLDELADQAWQAARPIPVRLVAEQTPVDPELLLLPISNQVTRPVPAGGPMVAAEAADDVADGLAWLTGSAGAGAGGHRQPKRAGRTARAVGVVAALASATAMAAVAVAMLVGGPGAQSAVPSSATSATTSGSATRDTLDAELRLALTGIGRSRAAAFASASQADLLKADQQGSPAYQADLALVGRLKSRGYRLQGVAYQIQQVHVLRRRAGSVDVSAVVTTSAHHQVATSSQVSVPVPEDGPRSVVFTVVPLGSGDAGPSRWRVNDVRAA